MILRLGGTRCCTENYFVYPTVWFAPTDSADAAKHPRDHHDRDLKTDLLKVILGGDTL
ncbi:MAG TPA: hypothetical protein PKC89_02505 [Pyrinomonadaceae bacterium]|nr:hypothetical protein [Pyrinomonadaceae bacterium]